MILLISYSSTLPDELTDNCLFLLSMLSSLIAGYIDSLREPFLYADNFCSNILVKLFLLSAMIFTFSSPSMFTDPLN